MKKDNFVFIRRFHGHLGPYVILGYLMGKYAKLLLSKINYITVTCYQRPPISCILDGLQLSTGCTLGKNTIHLNHHNHFKQAIFFGTRKKIVIMIKPKVKHLLRKNTRSSLHFIKQSSTKALFEIK